MNYYQQDNRFILPFLVGAVTGGAAIGLTRPRPIVSIPVGNNPGMMPMNGPVYPSPYPMNPGYSYGYNYYYRPY